MLVLTRALGQEIVIDKEVQIRVISIRGNTVRLGITAPRDVLVDRKEVFLERVQLARSVPELGEELLKT